MKKKIQRVFLGLVMAGFVGGCSTSGPEPTTTQMPPRASTPQSPTRVEDPFGPSQGPYTPRYWRVFVPAGHELYKTEPRLRSVIPGSPFRIQVNSFFVRTEAEAKRYESQGCLVEPMNLPPGFSPAD